MRLLASGLLGTAALLGSVTGWAQEFGRKGDAAISVERVFGFYTTRQTVEAFPGDSHADITAVTFAWPGAPIASPYDTPRAAFDYFVIDRLSLGGSLAYARVSPEGAADVDYFLLNPRIGYAYMFGPGGGIWPRGGLNYHSAATRNSSTSGLGLALECMFPIIPGPHFALEVGLTFDVDLTGTRDNDPGGEADFTYRSLGLRVGMFGWL